MSVYIIAGLTPKNLERSNEYGAAAAKTLAKYSGVVLARGAVKQLYGSFDYEVQVIILLPTKDEALGWYNSDEYQALIAIRDEGMDSQFELIG